MYVHVTPTRRPCHVRGSTFAYALRLRSTRVLRVSPTSPCRIHIGTYIRRTRWSRVLECMRSDDGVLWRDARADRRRARASSRAPTRNTRLKTIVESRASCQETSKSDKTRSRNFAVGENSLPRDLYLRRIKTK